MKPTHTARPPAPLRCALLIVCLTAFAAFASAGTALVRVAADAPGLATLGLELDHVTRQGDTILLPASEWDLEQLRLAGIAHRVVIADLEAYHAARLRAESWLWAGAQPEATQGFGFGSMGGYYTWSEVVAKLDEMASRYPSLVTPKQSLGQSHEGRDVWMVKLSDQANEADEYEPAVLFTGLTHAREPIGMEVLLYTMFHLLENYGSDPEVTYLLDQRELYFVPVVNPDGYVYNQTTNPNGGGGWRKNRRNNGGGAFGVDLNRNYGYQWGLNSQGSSSNPSSGTYRGPGPFSEPETTAIRMLHQQIAPITAFHYHAYGEYEIHPFAYDANAFPPPADLALYLAFGADLSLMNGYEVGNFAQTLNYLANGEAIDWSYGEQQEKSKVFAFLPEVGNSSDNFWPPASRILPLCGLHLGPNLYWAWTAGARGELVGASSAPTVAVGGSGDVVVTVENRGLGATAHDLTVSLRTNDPLVSIAVPSKAFPKVPVQGTATNALDPLQFSVSPAAPSSHTFALQVGLAQGPVQRGQVTLHVTTR